MSSRIPVCVCKGCGKEFKPKAWDRMTYCSRECFQNTNRTSQEHKWALRQANQQRSADRRWGPKQKRPCKWCHKEFLPKVRGKVLYCSKECLYQGNKEDARRKYTPKLPPYRFCKICNYLFCRITGKKGEANAVCCSDRCRKINAYHAKREYKTRREALLLGNRSEPYSRFTIFRRDGWICQLCNKPVDRRAQPNTHWFPTIDHRLPLSKGGADAPDNVQCAHHYCNSVKGTNLVDEIAS